jgi:uncharacterized YigZ family protein
MGRFLTILEVSSAEYVEKRSRFIANLRHCETEEEASAFLDEMRSKYWDARHNVFAYSVAGGTLCRFSDDGEPHGTAVKPILDVILGSEIKNIAIVVTRYFGGVLLGTGGLVRAYSKSAKDAVNNAKVVEMIPCTVYETVCEYTDHQRLVSIIENAGGKIENTEFTHDALHDALINLATEKGYKNGQILYPARIALTGKESTPGGAIEMALLLGKEESKNRINYSISLLKGNL